MNYQMQGGFQTQPFQPFQTFQTFQPSQPFQNFPQPGFQSYQNFQSFPSNQYPVNSYNYNYNDNYSITDRVNILEQKVDELDKKIQKLENKNTSTSEIINDNFYKYKTSVHMM